MNKNIKTVLIIGGVLVAILIIVPLIFGLIGGWQGYGYGGYGMMGPWMMGGYGGMGFMPIVMIAFWGLVIWGIVACARGAGWVGGGGCCGSPMVTSDSPLDILKRRYASGEISKEEFEEKKKILS